MKLKEFISDLTKLLNKHGNLPVKFASSPISEYEILSIYTTKEHLWIGIG